MSLKNPPNCRPVCVRESKRRKGRGRWWVALLLAGTAALPSGCQRQEKVVAPEVRPVRTIVAEKGNAGETLTLTGHIEAENEATLGFRIGGRVIERNVNVGDRVEPGQVLAKLDPTTELSSLQSAEAGLAAARASLTQARNNFDRQRQLFQRGIISRAEQDRAQEALDVGQAQVENALGQLAIAQERVGFTELKADAPGTVTARGAEPGEVVQAGQMIVRVARQEGRDAVFDLPAQVLRSVPNNAEINVRLVEDPKVTAQGRVREVAEQADPVTRTFQVKVGLINPPPEMRLGSTVVGSTQLSAVLAIAVPASALTRQAGQPAVWVVDPASHLVSLRDVEIANFFPDTVIVTNGLENGDIVVTAGVQALHPGQKVRLLAST